MNAESITDYRKAYSDLLLERDSLQETVDAMQLDHDCGMEILGEIVAAIEAVTPMPEDQKCKCIHCRHSRGVHRLIELAQ